MTQQIHQFIKNFSLWAILKPKLDNKLSTILIKERDIVWCSIGENIGDEESGKGDLFLRPVLVIRKFNSNLFFVTPLTTKIKDNPYYVKYTLHGIEYSAMISQIRVIDRKRMRNKVAKIDKTDYHKICNAIKLTIP